jgi:hypothetical protein
VLGAGHPLHSVQWIPTSPKEESRIGLGYNSQSRNKLIATALLRPAAKLQAYADRGGCYC